MLLDDKEKKTVKRKCWTRKWVLRRLEKGAYNAIFKELAIKDCSGFTEYMRMPHLKFIEVLNIISPHIQKKDSAMRMSIQPGER